MQILYSLCISFSKTWVKMCWMTRGYPPSSSTDPRICCLRWLCIVTQDFFFRLKIDCEGAAFFRDPLYSMTMAQCKRKKTLVDKGGQHLRRVGSFVAHLLNKVDHVLMMEALVVYPDTRNSSTDSGRRKYRFEIVGL